MNTANAMRVIRRSSRTPRAQPPSRPTNVLHDISGGIGKVLAAPMKPVTMLNEGFATATNFISQALPEFPAATMGSLALGMPHAHVLHPPSGPLPIPPTPIPPFGPVLLGCAVGVLINGKPAARCGDLGVAPTCCGLPPIFEVFTGSSKVFISGARAARVLDVTFHCKFVPPAGTAARGVIAAAKTAFGIAAKGMLVASMAAQGMSALGDGIEAVESDDSAMSAALGLSASMTAAQMASDAAAIAAGMAMGKDLCVPPGTLGAITLNTSGDVNIGGFPMPTWLNIAKGLLKGLKALRSRGKGGRKGKSSSSGSGSCAC